MATLRAQASVENENNPGTVMKKLIDEKKPEFIDRALFPVPKHDDNPSHSSGFDKHAVGPCFLNQFPDYLKKFYPHNEPLPLARPKWKPNWENYYKTKPFKIWVNPIPEYENWLIRVEKAKGETWRKSGIYNAIMMSSGMLEPDTPLISALAFFWSSSNNVFHFPCGMMSPTLHDVAFITGLRPHGIEANDALQPPKVSFEYPKKKDITFKIFLEQNISKDSDAPVTEMEHIAFLVYCYTNLAKSLSVGQEIALAPIFLAHVYRCMKELVDHEMASCTGPLWFVQLWAWAYFSCFNSFAFVGACAVISFSSSEEASTLSGDILSSTLSKFSFS